jgi:hypothetical protein
MVGKVVEKPLLLAKATVQVADVKAPAKFKVVWAWDQQALSANVINAVFFFMQSSSRIAAALGPQSSTSCNPEPISNLFQHLLDSDSQATFLNKTARISVYRPFTHAPTSHPVL